MAKSTKAVAAATKTITTTVTLQGLDAHGERGTRLPGTPVTLDAAEADRILARFGGAEVADTAGQDDETE